MNNFLSQLNLTPQERRTVVIIFLALFIVLNWVFVWPHFGDWGTMNEKRKETLRKIESYNHIIQQDRDPANGWLVQVQKLAKLEGGAVTEQAVDPQIQFQNTIHAQERKTGVFLGSINSGSVKTNEFFEEHTTKISVESYEPQLVSFLYNMGNDPAMIRVAQLDLKPVDGNRYRIKGGITLTANYAKKQAAQSAAAAAKPASGAKPSAPAGPAGPAQKAKRPPGAPPAPGANPKAPPQTYPQSSPKPKPHPGIKDASKT